MDKEERDLCAEPRCAPDGGPAVHRGRSALVAEATRAERQWKQGDNGGANQYQASLFLILAVWLKDHVKSSRSGAQL